jgi:hypothetical protein
MNHTCALSLSLSVILIDYCHRLIIVMLMKFFPKPVSEIEFQIENHSLTLCAGIFKKSMGTRHRVGIGLLYRPARLHRLAEFIPWNRFRGPIHVQKYQLCSPCVQQYSRVGMREHPQREHRGGVQKDRALLPGEQEREHGGGVQKVRALLPGEQQLQG